MTPLLSLSNRHLPVVGSFLKRCPMFRVTSHASAPGAEDLVNFAFKDLQSGNYRAGDRFPTPGQMADLTGVPLVDSLEVTTILLKSGYIRQSASGHLTVSPTGASARKVTASARF